MKKNSNYTYYSFENSISVCFNYKNIPAKKLCTLLYEESEIMVGYGTFQKDEFIRLVTINAGNSEKDILHFFRTLETFAEKHKEKLFDQSFIQN